MDLVHFLTGMNKPSVVTYHSDIIRQRVLLKLYRPLMGRFLHSVDRIAVASPNYFSTSDVLRQYREKTRVITYGLDKACYPKACGTASGALARETRAAVLPVRRGDALLQGPAYPA